MNYNYESTRSKKILAIALVSTLLLVVTILATVGVANRRVQPNDTTPNASDTTPATTTPTEGPQATDPNATTLPSFMSPVQTGQVSFEFSNSLPVFSLTMNDYRVHNGVDISSPLGAEVYAVADGTVVEVWEDVRMGTCVSIAHTGNAVSTYKNLNPQLAENIKRGAYVKSGEVIGLVGDSAMIEIAQESHLHYELAIDSVAVDPCRYIQFPQNDVTEE
ncbi:MAG: M23 family metallopeptidase [Clostridia bacterium]|nr:M23 family metallopeptidase [Clostridia bacterium]